MGFQHERARRKITEGIKRKTKRGKKAKRRAKKDGIGKVEGRIKLIKQRIKREIKWGRWNNLGQKIREKKIIRKINKRKPGKGKWAEKGKGKDFWN